MRRRFGRYETGRKDPTASVHPIDALIVAMRRVLQKSVSSGLDRMAAQCVSPVITK
jgi:hypothetical protein